MCQRVGREPNEIQITVCHVLLDLGVLVLPNFARYLLTSWSNNSADDRQILCASTNPGFIWQLTD
jgi:hypothetical protein